MPETPSEGLEVTLTEATLPTALAWAHDYRGDVTLRTKGGEQYVGYVFDLTKDRIRIDPADGSPRMTLQTEDIAAITFSGRDMAAGKSFDRWINRYIDKTLAGEEASIPSDAGDD
jgi:hypothetical protein